MTRRKRSAADGGCASTRTHTQHVHVHVHVCVCVCLSGCWGGRCVGATLLRSRGDRGGAVARRGQLRGGKRAVSSNAFAQAGVGRGPSALSEDSLNLTWKLSSKSVVLTEAWPCSSCAARPSDCSVVSPKLQCWRTCQATRVRAVRGGPVREGRGGAVRGRGGAVRGGVGPRGRWGEASQGPLRSASSPA